MNELDNMRQEIDRIDNEIIGLIKQRIETVRRIGEFKEANHLPALDSNRFEQVLLKWKDAAVKSGLDVNMAEEIYSAIHKYSLLEEEKQSEPIEKIK